MKKLNQFNIFLIGYIDLNVHDGATKHFLMLREYFINSGLKIKTIVKDYPIDKKHKNNKDLFKIPIWIPQNIFFLKTFLILMNFEICLFLFLFLNHLKRKIHLIYLRESPLNFAVLLMHFLFKIPYIIESNSLIIEDLKEGNKKFACFLEKYIEKLNFRFAQKIITVTNNMKNYYISLYKLLPQKIDVIPNGFDFNHLKSFTEIKQETQLRNKKTSTLLYLGKLHKREGIHILLSALALIKDRYSLLVNIVGQGKDQEFFKDLSEKLNLGNKIVFTGPKPYSEVGDYISQADICFAPLVRYRNEVTGVSPIKVFEYLAYKKPIIASRLPGLEFIEENKIGLLFEPDNPKDLAEKIEYLIHHYDEAIEMGKKGFEYVKKYHDYNLLHNRIIEMCLKYVSN